MYNKKVLSKATAGLDKAKAPAKKKDIIVDPMGQWKHPGQNTRIPSSNITMQGVNYPVLGVGSNGQQQMMYPGMEYTFPGADYVDEFPQMQTGGVMASDNDYIEADLTDDEIEEYRKGGYIVEDVSVPELTKAQLGKNVSLTASPFSLNANAIPLASKVFGEYNPELLLGAQQNLKSPNQDFKHNTTVDLGLPYTGKFAPSVNAAYHGAYDLSTPGQKLRPTVNSDLQVGYHPKQGVNFAVIANPRLEFSNVGQDTLNRKNWSQGAWKGYVGLLGSVGYRGKTFDPNEIQGVPASWATVDPKGSNFLMGYGANAGFEARPFRKPLKLGIDASIMESHGKKAAEQTVDSSPHNYTGWTPTVNVHASYPLSELMKKKQSKTREPNLPKNRPSGVHKFQEGGNYYTVPGSDGVYRKVNGKWQVDWNRSGNFQPLSKGDVAKRTAALNKQAKPLYDADYDHLVASRKYVSAPTKTATKPQTAEQKKAQQNFNQNFKVSAKDNYTKVQDKIKTDQEKLIEWGAANNVPVTQKELDDVENWGWNVYGKVGVQGRPDQINSYTPEAPQGFLDKSADILSNPMTSLGYFMRGQDIPDYMQRDMDRGTFGYYANGDLHTERNPLDFVSDFTPLGLVNDSRNVINGISEGDLGKTGLGLLSAVPGFSELRSASKAFKAADKIGDVSKGVSKLDIRLMPDDIRSKELDMETFGIYNGNTKVGEVSGNRLSNGDFETMDIGIDPQFQKQGIGTETYRQLNQSLPEGNKVRSWGAFVEENGVAPGRNTWQSLEKKGLAKKNEKGIYEMLPNTTSNLDNAVKAGIDGNFITRPLTLFGKNELTPGDQWYRKIGNEAGLRDLINKQGAQAPAPMRMRSGMTLDAPFFGRGTAPNENYKGLFAVEVKPEAASKYDWRSRVAGVDNYGSVPLNNEGIMQNMPLEDLNVYKKKWFSNNYKKLDPNNLEQSLMNAPVQRTLENAYKWGARGYLGKSAYDYMNQPEKKDKDLSDYYQKGGKLGPIHLNEGRKTLRDYVYGADIGMLQEQQGGYIDAELTDEEIQAYRDAGYDVEELG